MNGSLKIGKIWGAEVRLHWSLILLIPYVWIAFHPSNLADGVRVLLLIVGIFVCVALHELGHTGAARLFGVETKSITLWPLGGFASLSRRPDTTWQNVIVVAGGPAVNLFLALLFGLLVLAEQLLLRTRLLPTLSYWLYQMHIYSYLMGLLVVNASLFLLNLIPIYPLDGGQITRDLLKMAFGDRRANMLMILVSLPLALIVSFIGLATGDVVLIISGLLLVLASLSLNPRMANGMSLGTLYMVDRGGYYQKNSDYDRAIREYTQAIERQPDRPGLYINRALAHQNLFELLPARADVERALALDSRNPLAWCLSGEVYVLEGNLEQALACFNRAVELAPDWAIAYADRGAALMKLGSPDMAISDLNRAIALGPEQAVIYVIRSMARVDLGDLNGALEDAREALKHGPQWMLVFSESFVEGMKDRLEWVMAYYNRAVEMFPNSFQAYQGRGDALRVNHRLDWALEDYQRAIRLAPKNAELYLARGITYTRLGHPDNACADFRLAAQLADRGHIKRLSRKYLESIP